MSFPGFCDVCGGDNVWTLGPASEVYVTCPGGCVDVQLEMWDRSSTSPVSDWWLPHAELSLVEQAWRRSVESPEGSDAKESEDDLPF